MIYLLIFLAEGAAFFAATLNIRACAKGMTGMTLSTDAVIAGLNFFIISKIAESASPMRFVAYISGALGGSYVGMWYSKHWREE